MTKYYISNQFGTNSNSGTDPASPLATISHAVAIANSGDILSIIDSSTYNLHSDNAGNAIPLTQKYLAIEGTGASKITTGKLDSLSLPTLTPAYTTNSGDWTLDGSVGIYYFDQLSGHNPHCVFDSTLASTSDISGEVLDIGDISAGKMFYQEGSPDRIYYVVASGNPATNPGSISVRISLQPYFFDPANVANANDGITIRNLRFLNWSSQAILTGPSDKWRVFDCLFAEGLGAGVRIQGNSCEIRNNKFKYVGEAYDDSIVSITPIEANEAFINDAVIALEGVSNTLIRNNHIISSSLSGISIDGLSSQEADSKNNLVLSNYIEDSKFTISNDVPVRAAILCKDKNTVTCDVLAYNTIKTCGQRGISLSNLIHVAIVNNTVYDAANALYLENDITNIHWINNIVSETGLSWSLAYLNITDGGKYLNEIFVSPDEVSVDTIFNYTTNRLRNNIYQRSPRGTQETSILQFRWKGKFWSLTGWQDQTGFDLTSKEESPGFVSALADDLHLDDGANAIGFVESISIPISTLSNTLKSLVATPTSCGSLQYSYESSVSNEDLLPFLTGNERADEDTWGDNTSGSHSTGGLGSNPLAHKNSIILDLSKIFNHVDGQKLTTGVTQYRAIDIKNIALRPLCLSSGSGTKETNFSSSSGQIISLKAYLSKTPRDVRDIPIESPIDEDTGDPTTSIAIAFEAVDSSTFDGQGPLSTDETEPSGLTFSSPITLSSAIICPDTTLLPQRTLDGITTLEGQNARLWIRRTIKAGATYEKEDRAEITLVFSSNVGIFGTDDTYSLYVMAED